jgi:hypothetical protein
MPSMTPCSAACSRPCSTSRRHRPDRPDRGPVLRCRARARPCCWR